MIAKLVHREVQGSASAAAGDATVAALCEPCTRVDIGRTHARTPMLTLIQDPDIHIINSKTGEFLRALVLGTTQYYQPQTRKNR